MSEPAESKQSRPLPLEFALQWLPRALIFVSFGFILLFLYTALRRMGYPFSFDQVEGGTVTSVWRIAHGLPLYTPPTTDFVPFLYAPLYFYIAAALSKFMGAGYAALRLVSILSTLGSFIVIAAIVHSETRSRLAAIASAGLYAACYLPLQGWFDMGRVDSLSIFVLLLAIYCSRRAPILIAVLVWLIAFQVKQTVLPIAILVLCSDWQRPRRLIVGLVALLAGFGASVAVMNRLTAGWYSYYLFGTAKGLSWVSRTFALYIPSDLLAPFGLAFLIVATALLLAPFRLRSRTAQFYLFVSFSIYASIWYLRAHAGSSANTLMPAYAWTAVLFGLAFQRIAQSLRSSPSPHAQLGRVLLLSAALVQIAGLLYHPGRFIPGPALRQARERFEQQLRTIPGDIYVFNHSWDAVLAGKTPHAVPDAFGIIIDSPPSNLRTQYIADFQNAVDSHRYAGFVLDDTPDTFDPSGSWMPSDFLQQYPIRLLAESSYATAAGQPVERWIYLPCSVLDQDTSAFITPTSTISYGSCRNTSAAATPANN
jgi:hypothetical protein